MASHLAEMPCNSRTVCSEVNWTVPAAPEGRGRRIEEESREGGCVIKAVPRRLLGFVSVWTPARPGL